MQEIREGLPDNVDKTILTIEGDLLEVGLYYRGIASRNMELQEDNRQKDRKITQLTAANKRQVEKISNLETELGAAREQIKRLEKGKKKKKKAAASN